MDEPSSTPEQTPSHAEDDAPSPRPRATLYFVDGHLAPVRTTRSEQERHP
jgi:hypothetical protein